MTLMHTPRLAVQTEINGLGIILNKQWEEKNLATNERN